MKQFSQEKIKVLTMGYLSKNKMLTICFLLIMIFNHAFIGAQDCFQNLPLIDISNRKDIQTVIAAGTKDIYQGHPTTVLMPDGKTIYAFWTISHGGPCGPVAESEDGGYTWKRIDERMPSGYSGWHYICPTVSNLIGPDGKDRLWVFSGSRRKPLFETANEGKTWIPVNDSRAKNLASMWKNGVDRDFALKLPNELESQGHDFSFFKFEETDGKTGIYASSVEKYMARIVSEDGGKNWKEAEPLNFPFRMPATGMVRLSNSNYMMFGQIDNNGTGNESITSSVSKDGGFTWSPFSVIASKEGYSLCEPFAIRSPDGNRILCIIRENRRRGHSLFIVSKDDGETWSKPQETPWGLTGDRPIMKYAPDGRLVVVFRDMAPHSPTRGHFVAWIGTYKDIMLGLSGQYRVKLLHSYSEADCGYPGLELLPDGTFVATTYIRYTPGEVGNSIVTVHFKLEDIDQMIK
jgi:photosystem II stability/assembly factor-like uncharacterized protein